MQRRGDHETRGAEDPRRIGGQGGAVRGVEGMCGCKRLRRVNDHWDCRIGSADPVISRVFAHAERSWRSSESAAAIPPRSNPPPQQSSAAAIFRRGNPPPRQSSAAAIPGRRKSPPRSSAGAILDRADRPPPQSCRPRPRWGSDPCRSLVHSRSRGRGGRSVGIPRTGTGNIALTMSAPTLAGVSFPVWYVLSSQHRSEQEAHRNKALDTVSSFSRRIDFHAA
jgi:hypothetical protein